MSFYAFNTFAQGRVWRSAHLPQLVLQRPDEDQVEKKKKTQNLPASCFSTSWCPQSFAIRHARAAKHVKIPFNKLTLSREAPEPRRL